MEELNQAFEEYINEFKKLNTSDKKKEIINSIKEMIAMFEQMAISDGVDVHYLKSNEIKDIYDEDHSLDDFLEAELVYLEVAKNIIGEYLNSKM